ncbi:MAG: hypothetical protein ABIA04_15585 [Pseudomonadota bacterium]
MWPGEGSVAEQIVPLFQKNGIKWIATGEDVGKNSGHFFDNGLAYRIDGDSIFCDNDNSDAMTIVFRSGSDPIGFEYCQMRDDGYYHLELASSY